jgi:hypothetical protein
MVVYLENVKVVWPQNPTEPTVQTFGEDGLFRIKHFAVELGAGVAFCHQLRPFQIV